MFKRFYFREKRFLIFWGWLDFLFVGFFLEYFEIDKQSFDWGGCEGELDFIFWKFLVYDLRYLGGFELLWWGGLRRQGNWRVFKFKFKEIIFIIFFYMCRDFIWILCLLRI